MQGRRSDDSFNELAMQGASKMLGVRAAVQSSTLTIDGNAAMIRRWICSLLIYDAAGENRMIGKTMNG